MEKKCCKIHNGKCDRDYIDVETNSIHVFAKLSTKLPDGRVLKLTALKPVKKEDVQMP